LAVSARFSGTVELEFPLPIGHIAALADAVPYPDKGPANCIEINRIGHDTVGDRELRYHPDSHDHD
jgi:hypothetical protein